MIYNKTMKTTNKLKISATKAVELINNSKGKRFTVVFTKANGTDRTINGSRKNQSPLGNISMYSTKDKGIRSFNPHNLKELRINGNIYKIS